MTEPNDRVGRFYGAGPKPAPAASECVDGNSDGTNRAQALGHCRRIHSFPKLVYGPRSNLPRNRLHPQRRRSEAHVAITIFFADREPAGPYRVTVAARRTLHLRFNDLKEPAAIPRDTDYSSVFESDVPIVVQHTRLDSRHAEVSLLSTIAYARRVKTSALSITLRREFLTELHREIALSSIMTAQPIAACIMNETKEWNLWRRKFVVAARNWRRSCDCDRRFQPRRAGKIR